MENQPGESPHLPEKPAAPPRWNASTVLLMLLLAVIVAVFVGRMNSVGQSRITIGMFDEQLAKGNIAKVAVKGMEIQGEFVNAPEDPDAKKDSDGNPERLHKRFSTVVPPYRLQNLEFDKRLGEKLGRNYGAAQPDDNTNYILGTYVLVAVLLIGAIWFMYRRTQAQVLGGGLLSGFSKSPAKRYQSDRPVTFADVAGLEGVKGRTGRGGPVSQKPREVPAAWGTRAEGHSAHGATGHRQDAPGPRGGGRGRSAVLLDQRL